MLKIFIIIIVLNVFYLPPAYSETTYDLKDYPKGTSTMGNIKSRYTPEKINAMLDNLDILRNINNNSKTGFLFIDPDTQEKNLVCNEESDLVIFEYLKKLRQEINLLKARLQSAGIY